MALFERSQFAAPDDDAGVMIDGLGRERYTSHTLGLHVGSGGEQ